MSGFNTTPSQDKTGAFPAASSYPTVPSKYITNNNSLTQKVGGNAGAMNVGPDT